MRYALVLAVVAGCRSIFGISDPALIGDASTLVDSRTDAGDASVSCVSFSTLIDTCALPEGGAFPPTATFYDSDTGKVTVGVAVQSIVHSPVMTTAGAMVDAIPITRYLEDTDTALRVTGTLPVAFVAIGEIEISGHLDVSAGGAGAGCDVTGTGNDGLAHGSSGDGGGGGGGAVAGAAGGASGGGMHASGGAAQLGFAGGCAGGNGGLIDVPIAAGGGVVYLISAQQINVGGVIDASGAGGKGGISNVGNHGGGGGGGGGGSLILEAPNVANAGQINATGGGGGGGSSLSGNGNPGKLGSAGGQGGTGAVNNGGGRGGNGTVNAMQGSDSLSNDGAGGGGGATGRIHIITPTLMSTGSIAPPAL